ncbi:hypothetical protein L873DRAFT_401810 [Choiromyces venosus 120613-1]|uniref:Uncharacterized protein n=1 Tax=Choiromyces venosus 120613-1 TaxID=1336337 RepID=A0A3N4J001_9PEZI|nr:hypothetical protein L873DRAFT_401810 [Choiromyces venosus 120613-1]
MASVGRRYSLVIYWPGHGELDLSLLIYSLFEVCLGLKNGNKRRDSQPEKSEFAMSVSVYGFLHGNDRIATTIQNEKCQDSHYKRSQEKGGKTLLQLNDNLLKLN